MIKLKLLYRAVKDLKSGRNMSDAVVLKAHVLGSRCAPEVEAKLEGERAAFLLGVRFEERWETPLDALRKELALG